MEKIIRITGTGTASAKPDTITIGMTINSLDKDYNKALTLADKAVMSLKNSVTKAGLHEDKVLTTNFSIRSEDKSVKQPDGNYTYVFSGFRVAHNIKIVLPFDTKLLAKVIEAISESNSQPRLSIKFEVENTEQIEKAMLADAVKRAREDAEILTNAAGVKLGDILSINHSFSEVNVNYKSSMTYECKAKAASYESESMQSLNPDDIDFDTNVTIEWSIV